MPPETGLNEGVCTPGAWVNPLLIGRASPTHVSLAWLTPSTFGDSQLQMAIREGVRLTDDSVLARAPGARHLVQQRSEGSALRQGRVEAGDTAGGAVSIHCRHVDRAASGAQRGSRTGSRRPPKVTEPAWITRRW